MNATIEKIKTAILRSWIGQEIWYRYVKPPGAYCKVCGRYYTYRGWDKLSTQQIYPHYKARHTNCDCGAHEWKFVG